MPVYRPENKPVPTWDGVIKSLADELQSPTQSKNAPVFFEDQISQSRSINVIVLWESWENIPQEHRGVLILDAYGMVNKKRMQQIRFAIGLTPDEATRGGYLPYKIVPTIRRSDRINQKAVRHAM